MLHPRAAFASGCAAGITRFKMRRPFLAGGMTFVRSGRSTMVPLSELRTLAPAVWNNLVTVEKLRMQAIVEHRTPRPETEDDDRE